MGLLGLLGLLVAAGLHLARSRRHRGPGSHPLETHALRELEDDEHVEICVLYFDGCPSWQIAVQRLQAALKATGQDGTAIDVCEMRPPTDLAAAGFAGSPTILLDGQDFFRGPAPVNDLTCRLYPTELGLQGSPSVEALTAALRAR